MADRSPATRERSRIVRGGPRDDSLYVKMPMLPNYLNVSADQKHWLLLSVSQIHPKVLRRVARAWGEQLAAKSKLKEKK